MSLAFRTCEKNKSCCFVTSIQILLSFFDDSHLSLNWHMCTKCLCPCSFGFCGSGATAKLKIQLIHNKHCGCTRCKTFQNITSMVTIRRAHQGTRQTIATTKILCGLGDHPVIGTVGKGGQVSLVLCWEESSVDQPTLMSASSWCNGRGMTRSFLVEIPMISLWLSPLFWFSLLGVCQKPLPQKVQMHNFVCPGALCCTRCLKSFDIVLLVTLSKQGTSFHIWTLNLSGQPMETYNSECISNQTNNWNVWTQIASTPNHASKLSLQESAKDCLNWQQSRKQTRTCHQTKSTHNTSKLCNMQD